MLPFDSLNKGERPLRLLAWGVLSGLFVLAIGLWRIQILNGSRYKERQLVQSFRSVRVPAVRGRILDREGRVLADTRPRYRLDLYLDELAPQFFLEHSRQRRELMAARGGGARPAPGILDRLAARFRRTKTPSLISPDENEQLRRAARFTVVSNVMATAGSRLGTNLIRSEETVYRHWYSQRYLPFPLLDNLTPAQVAIITEQGWNYPGLELEQVPTRTYPEGQTAAHILGHVRREDATEPDEPEYDYHLPDYRGRKGMEFSFDHQLRGQPGAKSILVNSGGYRVGERVLAESIPGQTLKTTLDLRLQQECERSLDLVSADERGSVVVLDCRNGDILAMASAPTFDPNSFIPTLSVADNARYTNEVQKPMLNRATDQIYAPGSTFKVFTALALMDAGVELDEDFEVKADPARSPRGAYWIGSRKIEDTVLAGHYDFHKAFIKSSNSYFIDHALRPGLGMRRFLDFGHRFGFGESTHLKVTRDESGIFPQYGEVLSNGQTYDANNRNALADAAIGQQIALTPLQLAVAYAAVANGGTVHWPRIVERLEPADELSDRSPDTVRPGQVRSQLGLRPEHLKRVQEAMRDDVADPAGTGKEARVEGFAVCGKTGTAEIKADGRKDKVTWFASFGPFEKPRYAVIVMVESGRSGGGTCAPVAQRIYQFLHQRDSRARGVARIAAGGEN